MAYAITKAGVRWFLDSYPMPMPLNLMALMKAARENEGSVPTRGTGNYSSDEAKEIARLKRELRDTKDALEILKKAIGILGK